MEIRLTKPNNIPAHSPRSIHEIIKYDRSTYALLNNYRGGLLVKIDGEVLSDVIDYWYEGRKKPDIDEKILDFEIDYFVDEQRAIASSMNVVSTEAGEIENYSRA